MLLVVAAQTVVSRTVFGRYATATGTNQEAVRLAGIDTTRIKLTIFAMSGLLAGLAGVMQISRLASADPNAGTGFELNAIAAAVIGGTRLMGGKGSVINTFLGVVIIWGAGVRVDTNRRSGPDEAPDHRLRDRARRDRRLLPRAMGHPAEYRQGDIEEIVDRAIAVIPTQSDFHQIIQDVIALHDENPDDWTHAWDGINRKWAQTDLGPRGLGRPGLVVWRR